jgi:hypothetical protein
MATLVATLTLSVTVTWYDGPGPNTSCGQPFDTAMIAAAAPLSGPLALPCGQWVTLCLDEACIYAVVWDRMPDSSAARYGGLALDLTPAAMQALGIPFGQTAEGIPYGRARATLTLRPDPPAPPLPPPIVGGPQPR